MSNRDSSWRDYAHGIAVRVPSGTDPELAAVMEGMTLADTIADDAGSDFDRGVFAENPEAGGYLRLPMPGEGRYLTPPGHYCSGVVVNQILPGVRARAFFFAKIDGPIH